MAREPQADLPLRYQTPATWTQHALRWPLELLNDHAHLEKKAATNALELLNRWPEPNPPENWVAAMTAVARDEVEHLAIVSRLLARRGGKLSKSHANPYASELHSSPKRFFRKRRSPSDGTRCSTSRRRSFSASRQARACTERDHAAPAACFSKKRKASSTFGLIVSSPGCQSAGQTSPLSLANWHACTIRSVSSTLRPTLSALIVAC